MKDVTRRFIEDLVVGVAMHADETRFGTGLAQDAYEDACEEVADMFYSEVYGALANRDPR